MDISIKDFFENSFVISINDRRLGNFYKIFDKMFGELGDSYRRPKHFYGYTGNIKPTYCCELSHISLIRMAKCLDLPFIVIFEDDAFPRTDICDSLVRQISNIPDCCKILVLGWLKYDNAVPFSENFNKFSSWVWGTQSYIVFKSGYDEYIKEYDRNTETLADEFFSVMKDSTLLAKENLFIQYTEDRSMNGYFGYVWENVGMSEPPEGFMSFEKVVGNEKNEETDILKLELLKFGKFLYRLNGGNAGDFIISSSEFQLFDNLGLEYTQITKDNKEQETKKDFNLVYGGGGLWVKYYNRYYLDAVDSLFKNKFLKKCIILPSSFYECDDVLELFDERFTVFCRDINSYNYCRSTNDKAKFILHEDDALSLDIGKFDYSFFLDGYKSEFPRIRNTVSTLIPYLKSNFGKTASFLRTDVEKTVKPPSYNFDLSNVFGSHGEYIERKECDEITSIILNVVNRYDKIITNRLHILISSVLLGKNVEAYDNSYGKISSVYDYCLKDRHNITLHRDK